LGYIIKITLCLASTQGSISKSVCNMWRRGFGLSLWSSYLWKLQGVFQESCWGWATL